MSSADRQHRRARAVVAAFVAAWIGAALLTAAVVAPAAFEVLPSRAFAGMLIGRVLRVLFLSGMAVGFVAMLIEWFDRVRPLRPVRVAAPLAMALACAASQLLVAPRIAAIRGAIGSAIDLLGDDDPRRIAFGRLHALSVGYLAIAMIAASVCVWLAMQQRVAPEAA